MQLLRERSSLTDQTERSDLPMVTRLVGGRGGIQAQFYLTSKPMSSPLLLAASNLMAKPGGQGACFPRRMCGVIF